MSFFAWIEGCHRPRTILRPLEAYLGEGLTGLFPLILHPSAVPLWSFVLNTPLPLLSSLCLLLSVAALLKAYLFLVVFVSTAIYHKLGPIEDPAAL